MNLPLNIDYSGKVVVVTGAGGLICGAMARAFAQSGAKVAALDLNEEAVKKLANELKAEGYVCEGYKANVLESASGKKYTKRFLKTSALAISSSTARAETTPEQRRTTNINTKRKRGASLSSTSILRA